MFHVELRQFPNSTRAFNLSREQLDARVLVPWVRGQAIDLHERRWSPERCKLAVYEGPEVATEQMGMGRGWAGVTKTGEDVTARVLDEARGAVQSPPALETLKSEIAARCADGPLTMEGVLDLAGEIRSDLSANERVELAARAVWELLGDGRLALTGPVAH